MNVGNRINARKVVLSYFYQCCFFRNLEQQENILNDVLSAENVFQSNLEDFEQNKLVLKQKIDAQLKVSEDENFQYFVNIFFNKRNVDEIDMDYVMKVGGAYEKFLPEVIENINKYAQSFTFQEMNSMNQALFVLGYIERRVLETPKEILLNELIELAKRFDDEGSPKLINGIMHKIVNNIE